MSDPDRGGGVRRLLRRPVLVVVAWLAVAAAVLVASPSLTTVAVQDDTALLPHDAPSQQAGRLVHELFPHDPSLDSALIVLSRPGGLTAADRAYEARLSQDLAAPDMARTVASVESPTGLSRLSSVLTSPDGTTSLLIVGLRAAPFTGATDRAVTDLRRLLDATAPAGLTHHLGGVAGLSSDETAAVTASFTRTAVVSVVLVLAILLYVYRSLTGALVPLVTAGVAFAVSLGLIGILAGHGLEVSTLATTLMVVMVFGAGTDYCLFLVSRYRDEVARGAGVTAAVRRTRRTTGPVIAASGTTVIAAFLSLLTARMGVYRTIGPAAGIAVAVTVAAGLTLTPALLELVGGRAFRTQRRHRGGAWPRLGRLVRSHPVAVSLATVAALLLCASGLVGFHQSFDLSRELPGSADSRLGTDTIAGHLPTGELAPIVLVVSGNRPLHGAAALRSVDRLTDALRALPGVAEVRSVTQPAGAPLTLRTAPGLDGMAGLRALGIDPNRVDVTPLFSAMTSPGGLRLTEPVLRAYPQLAAPLGYFAGADGASTRLMVISRGDPYGPSARALLSRVGSTAAATLSGGPLSGARLAVGGPPAIFADIETLGAADFHRVAAVLLVAILVVLVVLLRSPVTPLYLLATVVLSYAAALGLTATLFSRLLGQGDISFWVPPFLFVILVALGADYNIFITSRMREALDGGATVPEAAVRGLVETGPVISSAGLILAGTFLAMVTVPLHMLAQMGFAVCTGVLIDTFVVRPLLVPALTVWLGGLAFWPSSARTRPRRSLRTAAVTGELGLAAAALAAVLVATQLGESLTSGRVPGSPPAGAALAGVPATAAAPATATPRLPVTAAAAPSIPAPAHRAAPVAAPATRATPPLAPVLPATAPTRIAIPTTGGWLFHLDGTRRIGVVGSEQPFSEEVTTQVTRAGGSDPSPVMRLSTSSNSGTEEDQRRYAPSGVELLSTQGSTTGLAFGGTFQPPLLLLASPVRQGASYSADWSTGATHGHTTTTVTGTRAVSVAGHPYQCTVTESDSTFGGDVSGSRHVTSCWVAELGMSSTDTEHDRGTYQGVPFDVTLTRVLEAPPR